MKECFGALFFVSRKPLVVQGVQKSLSDEKSNKKKKTPL